AAPIAPPCPLEIPFAVTTRRVGRRTVVLVDGQEGALTNSLPVAPLLLFARSAEERGAWVEREENGIAKEAPSRINTQLADVLEGLDFIETDDLSRVRVNPVFV